MNKDTNLIYNIDSSSSIVTGGVSTSLFEQQPLQQKTASTLTYSNFLINNIYVQSYDNTNDAQAFNLRLHTILSFGLVTFDNIVLRRMSVVNPASNVLGRSVTLFNVQVVKVITGIEDQYSTDLIPNDKITSSFPTLQDWIPAVHQTNFAVEDAHVESLIGGNAYNFLAENTVLFDNTMRVLRVSNFVASNISLRSTSDSNTAQDMSVYQFILSKPSDSWRNIFYVSFSNFFASKIRLHSLVSGHSCEFRNIYISARRIHAKVALDKAQYLEETSFIVKNITGTDITLHSNKNAGICNLQLTTAEQLTRFNKYTFSDLVLDSISASNRANSDGPGLDSNNANLEIRNFILRADVYGGYETTDPTVYSQNLVTSLEMRNFLVRKVQLGAGAVVGPGAASEGIYGHALIGNLAQENSFHNFLRVEFDNFQIVDGISAENVLGKTVSVVNANFDAASSFNGVVVVNSEQMKVAGLFLSNFNISGVTKLTSSPSSEGTTHEIINMRCVEMNKFADYSFKHFFIQDIGDVESASTSLEILKIMNLDIIGVVSGVAKSTAGDPSLTMLSDSSSFIVKDLKILNVTSAVSNNHVYVMNIYSTQAFAAGTISLIRMTNLLLENVQDITTRGSSSPTLTAHTFALNFLYSSSNGFTLDGSSLPAGVKWSSSMLFENFVTRKLKVGNSETQATATARSDRPFLINVMNLDLNPAVSGFSIVSFRNFSIDDIEVQRLVSGGGKTINVDIEKTMETASGSNVKTTTTFEALDFSITNIRTIEDQTMDWGWYVLGLFFQSGFDGFMHVTISRFLMKDLLLRFSGSYHAGEVLVLGWRSASGASSGACTTDQRSPATCSSPSSFEFSHTHIENVNIYLQFFFYVLAYDSHTPIQNFHRILVQNHTVTSIHARSVGKSGRIGAVSLSDTNGPTQDFTSNNQLRRTGNRAAIVAGDVMQSRLVLDRLRVSNVFVYCNSGFAADQGAILGARFLKNSGGGAIIRIDQIAITNVVLGPNLTLDCRSNQMCNIFGILTNSKISTPPSFNSSFLVENILLSDFSLTSVNSNINVHGFSLESAVDYIAGFRQITFKNIIIGDSSRTIHAGTDVASVKSIGIAPINIDGSIGNAGDQSSSISGLNPTAETGDEVVGDLAVAVVISEMKVRNITTNLVSRGAPVVFAVHIAKGISAVDLVVVVIQDLAISDMPNLSFIDDGTAPSQPYSITVLDFGDVIVAPASNLFIQNTRFFSEIDATEAISGAVRLSSSSSSSSSSASRSYLTHLFKIFGTAYLVRNLKLENVHITSNTKSTIQLHTFLPPNDFQTILIDGLSIHSSSLHHFHNGGDSLNCESAANDCSLAIIALYNSQIVTAPQPDLDLVEDGKDPSEVFFSSLNVTKIRMSNISVSSPHSSCSVRNVLFGTVAQMTPTNILSGFYAVKFDDFLLDGVFLNLTGSTSSYPTIRPLFIGSRSKFTITDGLMFYPTSTRFPTIFMITNIHSRGHVLQSSSHPSIDVSAVTVVAAISGFRSVLYENISLSSIRAAIATLERPQTFVEFSFYALHHLQTLLSAPAVPTSSSPVLPKSLSQLSVKNIRMFDFGNSILLFHPASLGKVTLRSVNFDRTGASPSISGFSQVRFEGISIDFDGTSSASSSYSELIVPLHLLSSLTIPRYIILYGITTFNSFNADLDSQKTRNAPLNIQQQVSFTVKNVQITNFNWSSSSKKTIDPNYVAPEDVFVYPVRLYRGIEDFFSASVENIAVKSISCDPSRQLKVSALQIYGVFGAVSVKLSSHLRIRNISVQDFQFRNETTMSMASTRAEIFAVSGDQQVSLISPLIEISELHLSNITVPERFSISSPNNDMVSVAGMQGFDLNAPEIESVTLSNSSFFLSKTTSDSPPQMIGFDITTTTDSDNVNAVHSIADNNFIVDTDLQQQQQSSSSSSFSSLVRFKSSSTVRRTWIFKSNVIKNIGVSLLLLDPDTTTSSSLHLIFEDNYLPLPMIGSSRSSTIIRRSDFATTTTSSSSSSQQPLDLNHTKITINCNRWQRAVSSTFFSEFIDYNARLEMNCTMTRELSATGSLPTTSLSHVETPPPTVSLELSHNTSSISLSERTNSSTPTFSLPLPKPKLVKNAISNQAVAAGIAMTALSGGANSMNARKIIAISSLADCGKVEIYDEDIPPVEPDSNPLFIRFGTSKFATYRGAIVGAVAFLVLWFILMCFFGSMRAFIENCSIRRGLRKIGVPGTLCVPGFALFPAAINAAAVIVKRYDSNHKIDMFLIVFAVATSCVIPLGVLIWIVKEVKAHEVLKKEDACYSAGFKVLDEDEYHHDREQQLGENEDNEESDPSSNHNNDDDENHNNMITSSSRRRRRGKRQKKMQLQKFFDSGEKVPTWKVWFDWLTEPKRDYKRSKFKDAFGPIFDGFTTPWFILVSFILVVGIEFAQGYTSLCNKNDRACCQTGLNAVLAMSALDLFSIIFFSISSRAFVFLVRSDAVCVTICSFLSLINGALVFHQFSSEDIDHTNELIFFSQAAFYISSTGAGLAVLNEIIGAAFEVREVLSARRRRQQTQLQFENGEEGDDLARLLLSAGVQMKKKPIEKDQTVNSRKSRNNETQDKNNKKSTSKSSDEEMKTFSPRSKSIEKETTNDNNNNHKKKERSSSSRHHQMKSEKNKNVPKEEKSEREKRNKKVVKKVDSDSDLHLDLSKHKIRHQQQDLKNSSKSRKSSNNTRRK